MISYSSDLVNACSEFTFNSLLTFLAFHFTKFGLGPQTNPSTLHVSCSVLEMGRKAGLTRKHAW